MVNSTVYKILLVVFGKYVFKFASYMFQTTCGHLQGLHFARWYSILPTCILVFRTCDLSLYIHVCYMLAASPLSLSRVIPPPSPVIVLSKPRYWYFLDQMNSNHTLTNSSFEILLRSTGGRSVKVNTHLPLILN